MNVGFIVLSTGVQKNCYTLRPIESNTLKGSSIQTMHWIELKFGIYIIGHHRTNPIDFDECCMHGLTGVQK